MKIVYNRFTGNPIGEFNINSRANLGGAYLRYAALSEANLSRANLSEANLSRANLTGTCLDIGNAIDAQRARDALERAGIVVSEHGSFMAYRTKRSKFCGDTVYEPGRTHRAPYFSTDEETECHPGLYFASREWLAEKYPGDELVRIVSNARCVIAAGDKFRCKRFRVVAG